MPDPIKPKELCYNQIKEIAQYLANSFGLEYGVRKDANGRWRYDEASWYALNFKQLGITPDDVELVLPNDLDDEAPTSWPAVIKKWDNYDPTPSGESA